jgi:hypothetical protein
LKTLSSNENTTVINKHCISTSTKFAPISDTPTTLAQQATDPLAHVESGLNILHQLTLLHIHPVRLNVVQWLILLNIHPERINILQCPIIPHMYPERLNTLYWLILQQTCPWRLKSL